MQARLYLLVSLAGLMLLSGCGQPTLAPVRGRVTCNGNPVPEAAVLFSPVPGNEGDQESGKAAQGGTDAEGRYVLSTYKKGDGALIGKHRVVITFESSVGSPCRSRQVVLEVKPGENDLDIELNQ